MFIIDEETGDATTRQGDTFNLSVSGISDDWTVYFSVYEKDTRNIVFELHTTPVDSVATFFVTANDSNKLTVPHGKKTEKYYYGIKRCKDNIEDTVIIGNKDVGDLNLLLVYPLITEGTKNGAS